MELLTEIAGYLFFAFDFFMHIDKHLNELIIQYGTLTYAILFIVIFCETGLVVTPFLPGDSLLFAAGTFAATGSLNISYLFILIYIAIVCGDCTNYFVGHFIGPKVFKMENSRIFKKKYLDRTHEFYEKYGGKTIIIARFVPIVRTFAPFVAGVGRMTFRTYIAYCLAGAALWLTVCLLGGYMFGNLEIVKKNFSLVIVMIIIISVMPVVIEFAKHYRAKRA